MVSSPPPRAAPPVAIAGSAAREPLRWDSAHLLGTGREALVQHRGQIYRLRLTAAGKLILTK